MEQSLLHFQTYLWQMSLEQCSAEAVVTLATVSTIELKILPFNVVFLSVQVVTVLIFNPSLRKPVRRPFAFILFAKEPMGVAPT